ncbi:MAG: dynamin family protein [Deltaproteobacteria bacterium]
MSGHGEHHDAGRDPGFRPLLTRAPFCGALMASPIEYDAAPSYATKAIASESESIKRAVAENTMRALDERSAADGLGRQARIAVELVAPIGLNIVRLWSLGNYALGLIGTAGPLGVLLAGPALFLTGGSMLRDLRRAFATDPKVRSLIEQASALSEQKAYRRAEALLKEALEQDIDPTYRRNGDLYLQLGLTQMLDRRPRQAMVSLAKASVLFGADETVAVDCDGRCVEVSKRGWTEMLACAAIDSFAHDDAGLDEWREVLGDFAQSAVRRLEHVAARKEAGHLFGTFGVDPGAAAYGRELAAKVQFLVAKMKLRSAGVTGADDVDALIAEATQELRAANLTVRERFEAFLEQGQFYAAAARREGSQQGPNARRALDLMDMAATCLADEDPLLAARVRAEGATFAMDLLPFVIAAGGDPRPLASLAESNVRALAAALEGPAARADLGPIARGWVQEMRYRLGGGDVERIASSTAAHRAYLDAGEPVAAMYAALRLAHVLEDGDRVRAAVQLVMEAARQTLSTEVEPGLRAFAAKYLLDAADLVGVHVGEVSRSASAELFRLAAKDVVSARRSAAFYLQGKLVIHPHDVAEVIYLGHAAMELARGNQEAAAVALFEDVRARALTTDPPAHIRAALDIAHAGLRGALGQTEEARQDLDRLERDARARGDTRAQHRALELLNAFRAREREASAEQSDLPLSTPRADGFIDAFLRTRDAIVASGRALIETFEAPGVADTLSSHQLEVVTRLKARLERLTENRFRVGIVGEFSAGKSTFLNALLGEAVLPSSVRPTTAVVNRIVWGPEPGLTITYRDGRREEAELESLSQYVTEKGNHSNRREVAEVEIRYPLALLENGVELLDTPGVQSLIAVHTQTTYALLPSCDAIVLLVTGRQPYSDSIGRFLSDLNAVVKGKLFYVLNKIDQLEGRDEAAAMQFATEWLKGKVDGAFLFPLAAYRALVARRLIAGALTPVDLEDDPRLGDSRDVERLLEESRVPAFERALGSFLVRQRGLPILREAARDLLAIYHDVETGGRAHLQSIRMDAQRRRTEWERLSGEIARSRNTIGAAVARLEDRCAGLLDTVDARARRELATIAPAVVERANVLAQDSASAEALRSFTARLDAALQQELAAWCIRLAADCAADLSASVQEARVQIQAARRELRGEFAKTFTLEHEAFTLNPESVRLELSLGDAEGPSLLSSVAMGAIGAAVGFAFGLIGLAGLAIVQWLFSQGEEQRIRELKEKATGLVDKRLEALRDDVPVRLRAQLESTVKALQSRLAEERDAIMSEFDDQLNTLIREQDDVGESARNRQVALEMMCARAGDARGRLERALLALVEAT